MVTIPVCHNHGDNQENGANLTHLYDCPILLRTTDKDSTTGCSLSSEIVCEMQHLTVGKSSGGQMTAQQARTYVAGTLSSSRQQGWHSAQHGMRRQRVCVQSDCSTRPVQAAAPNWRQHYACQYCGVLSGWHGASGSVAQATRSIYVPRPPVIASQLSCCIALGCSCCLGRLSSRRCYVA